MKKYNIVFDIVNGISQCAIVIMLGILIGMSIHAKTITSASVLENLQLDPKAVYEYRCAEVFSDYNQEPGSLFLDYEDHIWRTLDEYDLPAGTPCVLLMEKPKQNDPTTWKICAVYFDYMESEAAT